MYLAQLSDLKHLVFFPRTDDRQTYLLKLLSEALKYKKIVKFRYASKHFEIINSTFLKQFLIYIYPKKRLPFLQWKYITLVRCLITTLLFLQHRMNAFAPRVRKLSRSRGLPPPCTEGVSKLVSFILYELNLILMTDY